MSIFLCHLVSLAFFNITSFLCHYSRHYFTMAADSFLVPFNYFSISLSSVIIIFPLFHPVRVSFDSMGFRNAAFLFPRTLLCHLSIYHQPVIIFLLFHLRVQNFITPSLHSFLAFLHLFLPFFTFLQCLHLFLPIFTFLQFLHLFLPFIVSKLHFLACHYPPSVSSSPLRQRLEIAS